MKGRRADSRLHLELLRARGAANRIELALAMKSVSDRIEPLRRAADSIGSIASGLAGGGRPLKWIATAGGALMQARWVRRVVARAAARLHLSAVPGARTVALGALAVGAVALLIRWGRGSTRSDRKARRDPDEETG